MFSITEHARNDTPRAAGLATRDGLRHQHLQTLRNLNHGRIFVWQPFYCRHFEFKMASYFVNNILISIFINI